MPVQNESPRKKAVEFLQKYGLGLDFVNDIVNEVLASRRAAESQDDDGDDDDNNSELDDWADACDAGGVDVC